MGANMMLVFVETRDGGIKKGSLETLSEAKRLGTALGWDVGAVLVGPVTDAKAAEVLPYGASTAYVLESPALAEYSAQGFARALTILAGELKPEAILFSGTAMGRDLAPRVAAALGVSLASDCTKLAAKDGRLEFTRPIFAGKALLTFTLRSSPALATLRPNVFPLGSPVPATGAVVRKVVDIPDGLVRGKVVEVLREPAAEIDVTEAGCIVSGGRGLKGPEAFVLLRELVALLPRAAVGASRSAVDSGWIGHQHQVGQTGKTVSPDLYIACGISGAIQHLAGMSGSKVVAAVNKDPEAPIFKVADYGIVGDLFEVIPHLIEELKKL
jgi:electron transfer flavoprotein alpha subunit